MQGRVCVYYRKKGTTPACGRKRKQYAGRRVLRIRLANVMASTYFGGNLVNRDL